MTAGPIPNAKGTWVPWPYLEQWLLSRDPNGGYLVNGNDVLSYKASPKDINYAFM